MLVIFYLSALVGVLVWFLIKRQYSYWQRVNSHFPYDEAIDIPYGCLKPVAQRHRSMGMAMYDVYKRCKDRYVGVYLLFRPGLLVRDATLARQVLAQDFASFHDRGVYIDEENDPLSVNLFSLRGQNWKNMRAKLAPPFSSGKLKSMFSTSDDIGNKMVEHLKQLIPEDGSTKEVDIMDVLTTYAIDIVASVIFGLDVNSFAEPKNKFRTLVTQTRASNRFTAIFGMLIFLCPAIARFLFKLGFKNKVALGLRDILSETVEFREKHNEVRKDVLQMLMQLRLGGEISAENEDWTVYSNKPKVMSLDNIAAHAFIFYVAGQGTTATTAAFTLFELAQYPELLQRAQDEVQQALARYNGCLTYESLHCMEFIELCILETLRKYPGLPMLNRECTADYCIPGTDHIIERGTPIVISLFGIHRDAAYFPDPETYDPERFMKDKMSYDVNAYMPFGAGPRQCIALRMGKTNAKLAVAKILQYFHIEAMSRREIVIESTTVAIVPKDGVRIRLSRRT